MFVLIFLYTNSIQKVKDEEEIPSEAKALNFQDIRTDFFNKQNQNIFGLYFQIEEEFEKTFGPTNGGIVLDPKPISQYFLSLQTRLSNYFSKLQSTNSIVYSAIIPGNDLFFENVFSLLNSALSGGIQSNDIFEAFGIFKSLRIVLNIILKTNDLNYSAFLKCLCFNWLKIFPIEDKYHYQFMRYIKNRKEKEEVQKENNKKIEELQKENNKKIEEVQKENNQITKEKEEIKKKFEELLKKHCENENEPKDLGFQKKESSSSKERKSKDQSLIEEEKRDMFDKNLSSNLHEKGSSDEGKNLFKERNWETLLKNEEKLNK